MAEVENVLVQLHESFLSPPSPFNRLFVFTGTAFIFWPHNPPEQDDLIHERFDVNLSKLHQNRPFPGFATQVAASASLGSIHGTDNADEFTWAVDRAFADVSPDELLKLHVDVAMQGKKGSFRAFAYQVFVQTFGIVIISSNQNPDNPITVSDAPVPFDITLKFRDDSTKLGGRIAINTPLLDNQPIDLGFPSHIDIPPFALSTTISGNVPPHRLFPPNRRFNGDVVFATAGGVFTHQLAIIQV